MTEYINNNKAMIVKVAIGVATAGAFGYLIWKFGILEVIIGMIVNFVLLVPLALFIVGLVNENTYNAVAKEMDEVLCTIDAIIAARMEELKNK